MSTPSKTDIIFIGAGASKAVGLPTHRELTDHIKTFCDPNHPRSTPAKDLIERKKLRERWNPLLTELARSRNDTVDDFCRVLANNQSRRSDLQEMKRIIRLGMLDFINQKSPSITASRNPYERFINLLFRRDDSGQLNDCFGIVNINYDGCFGTLLGEMADARYCAAKSKHLPNGVKAAFTGTYCRSWQGSTETPDLLEPEFFFHYMPHGTITVSVDSRVHVDATGHIESVEDCIYTPRLENLRPSDKKFDYRDEWFLDQHYEKDPLIVFPWENYRLRLSQDITVVVSSAIATAERIHFIGISGHSLLKTTFQDLLQRVAPIKHILGKEWHIAVKAPEGKDQKKFQERTYQNIRQLFWPEGVSAQELEHLQSDLWPNHKCIFYDDFESWLDDSPLSESAQRSRS